MLAKAFYEMTRGSIVNQYEMSVWHVNRNVKRVHKNQFAKNIYFSDGSIFTVYKKGGAAWCRPNGQMMARRSS
jgi:hypothetical protein